MLPVLFEFGSFKLYTYPLIIGLAWGFAYHLIYFLSDKYFKRTKGLLGLMIGLFIVSWIGAKVLFLVVSINSHRDIYLSSPNFWLGGGFVYYGGLIASLIYVFIYTSVLKLFPIKNIIVFFPALSFSHALGRLGCFLAGCCYGVKTEFFKNVININISKHPVQIYELVCLVALGFLLLQLIKKRLGLDKIISIYIGIYAIIRYSLEFLRGDEIRGYLYSDFSTSQIISLFTLIVIILYWILKKIFFYRRDYE